MPKASAMEAARFAQQVYIQFGIAIPGGGAIRFLVLPFGVRSLFGRREGDPNSASHRLLHKMDCLCNVPKSQYEGFAVHFHSVDQCLRQSEGIDFGWEQACDQRRLMIGLCAAMLLSNAKRFIRRHGWLKGIMH